MLSSLRHRTTRLVVLIAFLCLSVSVTATWAQKAPRTSKQLRRAINSILDAETFENATWGVHIVELNNRHTLYARNHEKSFVPASNMKLFTSAAALDQLGPGFRYRTDLFAAGEVSDSVLHGHLIVRGSGDPTIGGRFSDGDVTRTFRDWADSLRAAGIVRVTGDVIGDDDVFDDVPLGPGWFWDDETYSYSAEIGGLVFNGGCVDITLKATYEGGPTHLSWEPFNTDYVRFVNQSVTVHADSSLKEGYERRRASNAIRVFSEVPVGGEDTESLTVSNSTLYFVHALRSTLLASGIVVEGLPVDVDHLSLKPGYAAPELVRVARYESPSLSRIVFELNKESDNLISEQLLKSLAVYVERTDDDLPAVGSLDQGVEVAQAMFASAGIDTARIRMRDGSGLSRYNLITPEMTTSLLSYMWAHADTAVSGPFIRSLPISGKDGTLESFPDSTASAGNVRAKTGTMTGVRNLSGYVTTAAGTDLAFSLLCNNYTVPTREVIRAQEEFVELLSRFRR